MKTNELLSKKVLTRDEKIAHLKKLGLWREYCKEVKRADLQGSAEFGTLENLLDGNTSWSRFIYQSFVFVRTDRGHDFWRYLSRYGKRLDSPKAKDLKTLKNLCITNNYLYV